MRNQPSPYPPHVPGPSYGLYAPGPSYGPYAPYAPFPSYAPVADRDEHWWCTPLLFTPLVVLLAYVDFSTAQLPVDNVLALGYLVPFALVGCSWLPARTTTRRPLRVTLSVLACVFAYFYSKILVMLWISAWLVGVFT